MADEKKPDGRTGMPSPRHRPTRPPRPKRTDSAFEITKAVFIPASGKDPDRFKVWVKRNLPRTEQIDELYMYFMLRGSDNPDPKGGGSAPAYFGSAYFRRNPPPAPSELDAKTFTMEGGVTHLRSDAMPHGPLRPDYSVDHPFEFKAIKKEPQVPNTDHFVQLVKVTLALT